jgi:transcriptional regulator with XRE-family HTH domain
MPRTRLQVDADRHALGLRRRLAEDLRQMRLDAGASQHAVARMAGVDQSVVSRVESCSLDLTLETYARIAAALGADLAARVYPNTGPRIRDRHQVRMAEVLIASLHPRWQVTPEVAVRRPVRGWIDLALEDPGAHVVVATELESDLRRIEQLIRWSAEKADAIGAGSRLLVVRWTRANRAAAEAARRLLRQAYPADPRDALEAITATAAWPGPALIWARIDRGRAELVA